MPRFPSRLNLPLAALALAGACSDSGGPSNQAQVNFSVATQPATTPSGVSLAMAGTPETFTDGSNTLVITGVQLVLREIELHRAGALADCADSASDDCEELEVGPLLLDLPLGTPGAARTFSVQLAPGSYDRIEFELHKPSDPEDAAFMQAHPDFEDISVRVTGTYNGEDFTYTGRFNDEQEFNLVPELIMGDVAAADLTLFANLDRWFRDPAGTLVHPNSANNGGPNQGLAEQNIKASLDAFEDENHDGRDDGTGHH